MPDDLHQICEELRQIGHRQATPERRKIVEEAAASKWNGVRVAAAKTLSQWGDPDSVRALKALIVEVAAKPDSATAGAVAKALMPHLEAVDLDWAIDVCLHQGRVRNRCALAVLFEAFAPDEVWRRMEAQSQRLRGNDERDARRVIDRARYRARRERELQAETKRGRKVNRRPEPRA